MRRFLSLAQVSMQENLTFRAGFLLNLVTPSILLGGQFMLWHSLYAMNSRGTIGSYDRSMMYTYLLLSFLLNNMLTWKSENAISRKIISGSIVTECVRPMPFLMQNLADMFGPVLLQAGINFVLVIGLFAGLNHYVIIGGAGVTSLFLISLVLAVVLRMLLISTFSLFCFYTTSHLGLTWTRIAITEFFSGAVIPVALFSQGLQAFTYCTPFPYMIQAPISIYLEQKTFFPVWAYFCIQFFWIIFFIALQRLCWEHIRKNINVSGG